MRNWLAFAAVLFSSSLLAQAPVSTPVSTDAKKGDSEPGIAVTHAMVKAKCSGCHRDDGQGHLTRISWERTTPEGWQQIIKRMVRLNGLTLTPVEAREIVKSLSETHGLAPDEAKPVSWYWEKRQLESEQFPSDTLRDACAACHPIAQPNSWRRSKVEWDLLASMHRGYFPVVEFNSFRRPPRPGAGAGRGATAAPAVPEKEPFEIALEHFTKANPLHTPEWAQWQAARRTPKLAGRWAVSAYLPGKGKFVGETVIEAGAADEFTSKTTLTSVTTGERVMRSGKAVVYTGYAWRGSATSGTKSEREVMAFSADQQTAEGRWFWGGYNEFGYDVTLKRAGDGPVVLATDIYSLPTGAKGLTVKVYGDALPAGLTAADLDFGSGISVSSIVSQTPNLVTVKVDVDAKAVVGKRDAFVRRAKLPSALAVYKTIDYIKTPASAIARLGGGNGAQGHPKGYFQFEAIGWSNGLDGKPETADDVSLGPVAAKWSMEEFLSRYGDDDKEYVGSLGAEGLFTPSIEGPNEKRKFSSNNFGDVWVVATLAPPGSDKPLVSKTYFIVTVPAYMRWDQPEVGQ